MQKRDEFEFNKYTKEELLIEKMNKTMFDINIKKESGEISDYSKECFTLDSKNLKNEKNKNNKRLRKNKKRINIIISTLIVLLVTIFGSFYNIYLKTKKAVDENKVEIKATAKTKFSQEPSNILFMGGDENVTDQEMDWRDRSKADSRTDTLILMRFDPIQKTIITSSLPRDTMIENSCSQNTIESYPYKKINSTGSAVYGENESEKVKNGIDCMVQEYKKNFNITINYVVRINMNFVIKTIDKIDGLEFSPDPNNFGSWTNGVIYSNDEYDNEDAYTFTAGQMTKFDGKAALAYGRSRKQDSDFYRGARQQEVVKEIIKKIAKSPALINDLPEIIKVVSSDVTYNFGGEIIDDLFILSKDLNQYKTKQLENFEMVKWEGSPYTVYPNLRYPTLNYQPSYENYVLTQTSEEYFEKVYNGKINLFEETEKEKTPK